METPQQPIADPNSSVISEEKKQQLIYAMGRLKVQAEDTKMRMNASKNRMEVERKKQLAGVFERMKLNGVDLTSRESVSGYINKLKQNNPETAGMFENAMDYLLTGGQNNMNNVNPNEALPENSRGYSQ